ncbi:BTAD domain-containing putative transcriptional regulator [Streptomyces sp. XD-27]|uniref:ATP-binding protein n=1 Tax=Streptomyces sp. XD-27 TaxID=3062779 RepID=UPI0026F45D6F|nr:BTAD domain-containing putative transcriptional regulator [Streptomyces sp. XD-27]WKX72100.1 BTAD domain-containing putative transcriptional regulator [Streptomyces sp. XD-27]
MAQDKGQGYKRPPHSTVLGPADGRPDHGAHEAHDAHGADESHGVDEGGEDVGAHARTGRPQARHGIRADDHTDGHADGHTPERAQDRPRSHAHEHPHEPLALAEARLDLALERGRHAEAVSELTALTAAHPLNERLRELLMVALYRSGRQAEALAVYADTRRLLAAELGIAPGERLTETRLRVLRRDPGLAWPAGAPAAPPAPTAPVRPAQLPATVADFTGRTDVAGELGARLAAVRGGTPAVLSVAGTGGIGKTALAVHVAHAARAHFPDGQLYVDLRGTGSSPVEPEAVLGSFLRALGTPDTAIPDGVEQRTALYRSALGGRRVLALLDNARDATQIRPLLPGTDGCAALVTSRVRMSDLDGAHLIDLDVLSPREAYALFAHIVGQERADVEREEARRVVAACGFLPLAIRIAASRLAARRTWTVSVLARKLADERRRLDELRAGDLAVKATFELGYGQLEHRQARAFRLLGLADGPDISLAAAAAVLDMDTDATARLLDSLVGSSLLESAVPGRYRFHDLVRLYARACAERDQRPAEREAALSRLLDFYLATAGRVHAMERPGDPTVEHLAPTAQRGPAFATSAQALDWLFTEADSLIACARQCVGGALPRRAADLLTAAFDLAESGAKSRPYEAAARAVSEAARAAGDARAEGRARSTLGHLYNVGGRFQEGDRELRRAIELGRAAADPLIGRMYNQRGIIALYQNRQRDAAECFARALRAFRAIGDEPGEASALSNLARTRLNTGRTQDGLEMIEQALAIYRRLGGSLRLGNGMYALGIALTRAGRPDEAVAQLNGALRIFRECRQQLWEGMTHYRLAETLLLADRPALAAEHAERALALRGLGGAWRRGAFLTVLGRALDAIGQTDRARACWGEALAIYEHLGSSEQHEVRELLSGAARGAGSPAAPDRPPDGSPAAPQPPFLHLLNGTDSISWHKTDEPPAV